LLTHMILGEGRQGPKGEKKIASQKKPHEPHNRKKRRRRVRIVREESWGVYNRKGEFVQKTLVATEKVKGTGGGGVGKPGENQNSFAARSARSSPRRGGKISGVKKTVEHGDVPPTRPT